MDIDEKHEKVSHELNCTGCGAILHFEPGTTSLKCIYCGAENPIEPTDEKIEEIDYEKFLRQQYDKEEKIEVASVKCDSCGAMVTLKPNVTSDQCPYCSSSLVISGGSTSLVLKPKSLAPFKIDRQTAGDSFRLWIKKRWFAPSKLKKVTSHDRMQGIYVPYWTYDANTSSLYTGQRGDYYYETQTYTTTENGRTVTKQRQVRRTRWTSVSGHVSANFDDILVVASTSLPETYIRRLTPWYLNELVPYDDRFLSGFRSESYQVDVASGLEEAKQVMDSAIRGKVRRDIGGDEQRIFSVRTAYNDITFKHILLPVWISAYRYKDKVYRLLINGQTGEVQGERPYSAIKIILTALIVIALIVAAILLFGD
jgi:LSD1 subclass zinc finger protein